MLVAYASDATRYISTKPHLCGICGLPHYWFVNANGTSACFGCADQLSAPLPKIQHEVAVHA